MPRNKSTAAQKARARARGGAKYTTALRELTAEKPPKRPLAVGDLAGLVEGQKPAIERLTATAQQFMREAAFAEKAFQLQMKSVQRLSVQLQQQHMASFFRISRHLEQVSRSAAAAEALQRSIEPIASRIAAQGAFKMKTAAEETARLSMKMHQVQIAAARHQRSVEPFLELSRILEKTSVMTGAVEAFQRDVEPLLPKLVFSTEDSV